MKRFLMYSLVALLGMATLSCSREDGADGINGINGIDGINGKTILSGKGEPSTSLGTIGDFYLNLDNYNLYGPKSEQGWGNPISLIGADGKDGADGRDGADGKDAPKIWTGDTAPTSSIGNEGDFYLDLKNKVLYGPKTNGNWGSGIVLGGGSSTLKGNYVLSADGTILLQWFNKDMTNIDMEADAELRNVTRIGAEVFSGQMLNTIVLPKGLKHIGKRAFISNRLTNVEIPNSVISIDSMAFSNNRLESVIIPNGIETIGVNAFSGNRLRNVEIPNSVIIIERRAFIWNQLESVVVPNSVKSIGYEAFGYIGSLVMQSSIPPSMNYSFYATDNFKIYVPKGSGDAYRNHKDWEYYKDYIVEQ